jgi:pimeloyl-ACP methyl ester carboxylesterase
MPSAEVNGQKLFYEDTGGDAPAVVFSHGLFMDHSMFDPQVEALRDRWRCIAWDERGHGQTGDALAPFTYWDSADDVIALLDERGVDQAVLAGMSQGGFLSLRAALKYPDRVRALILIDTQAGTEDPEKMPYYEQLVERWTTRGMDDELAAIIEAIILGAGWEGAAAWKEKWKRIGAGNLRQLFATLAGRDDIHDQLGDIGAPALVIHGAADLAIDTPLAQRLSDGLPNAELVMIEGAGHASNLTHPGEVNRHIERFLAGLS